MPAIWGRHVQRVSQALEPRELRNTVGQSGMTPTAFAFLIPVFVIVVFAPFLCVFCIRKRQPAVPVTAPKTKKPALRRAQARERLNSVTEVSNVTELTKPPPNGAAEQTEQVAPSSASFAERECAICLSTLHAPSPPEPARIAASNIIDEAVTRPPSINDVSPEAILKLNVCGHEFHAECLTSWVVLRKTSCPICRAVYITKEEMTQYDEEAELAATPAAEVPAAAIDASPATAARVTTWRCFWRGEHVFNRSPVAHEANIEMSAPAVTPEPAPRGNRVWPRRSR